MCSEADSTLKNMLVQLISTILEDTYTTDDLAERLWLLREHYHKLAFTTGEEHMSIRERFSGLAEPYVLEVVSRWEAQFTKQHIAPRELYHALVDIEQELSVLPSAMLYVPIHFSPEYIEQFGKWMRENAHPNLLLTIRTDARLAGGCGIVWKDVYHDFSLRYFINNTKDDLVRMIDTHLQHAE